MPRGAPRPNSSRNFWTAAQCYRECGPPSPHGGPREKPALPGLHSRPAGTVVLDCPLASPGVSTQPCLHIGRCIYSGQLGSPSSSGTSKHKRPRVMPTAPSHLPWEASGPDPPTRGPDITQATADAPGLWSWGKDVVRRSQAPVMEGAPGGEREAGRRHPLLRGD